MEVAAFEVYCDWGEGTEVVCEFIAALTLEEVKIGLQRWLISQGGRNGLSDSKEGLFVEIISFSGIYFDVGYFSSVC